MQCNHKDKVKPDSVIKKVSRNMQSKALSDLEHGLKAYLSYSQAQSFPLC